MSEANTLNTMLSKYIYKPGMEFISPVGIPYNKNDINRLFENAVVSEAPDIVTENDDRIIGIEHFCFDGSSNNKKGSTHIRSSVSIENNFKVNIDDYISKQSDENRDNLRQIKQIVGNVSIDNYIKNFVKHFENHANKIAAYKEKLSKLSRKEQEIWFIVENTDSYNLAYYKEDCSIKSLLPTQFSECINEIEKPEGLTGILYCCNSFVYVCRNDKMTLDVLRANTVSKDDVIYNYVPYLSCRTIPVGSIAYEEPEIKM